jgi:hypothetical protein
MPDFQDTASAPARKLAAVTPSDSTVLVNAKALWVTAAGTLAVVAADDTVAVSLGTISAGTLVPVRASKVMATGTTASVVAFF